MNSDQIIDYRSPSATVAPSRTATQLVLVITLLIPASFVAFCLLRTYQISLPDPFNNPYTNWSTGCLLAFFGLTLADFVLLIVFRRRVARSVRYLGTLAVLGSGAYIAWFVVGMIRFVYL